MDDPKNFLKKWFEVRFAKLSGQDGNFPHSLTHSQPLTHTHTHACFQFLLIFGGLLMVPPSLLRSMGHYI